MDSRWRGAIPLGGLLILAAAWRAAAGPAPRPSPAAAENPAVIALSAGVEHTCALLDDGRVHCWGNNEAGQLGTGTTGGPSTPMMVEGIAGATALAVGGFHTCVLLADGRVKCWGAHLAGQLGHEAETLPSKPVLIQGITGATALAAGGTHACALLRGGTVRCWGANVSGQLGRPPGPEAGVAQEVPGLTGATALSAGVVHTCALVAGGRVRCWGSNLHSQLGDGTTASSSRPVAVTGLADAVGVAAGGFHTCAFLADGRAKCWGANESGQLGNGINILRASTPVTMAVSNRVLAVGAGLAHPCARLVDGRVGWGGKNGGGQLGGGTDALESADPLPVSGNATATAIAVGGHHTCALLTDHTVRCWGANESGQLGDGTTITSPAPRAVVGLRQQERAPGHSAAEP